MTKFDESANQHQPPESDQCQFPGIEKLKESHQNVHDVKMKNPWSGKEKDEHDEQERRNLHKLQNYKMQCVHIGEKTAHGNSDIRQNDKMKCLCSESEDGEEEDGISSNDHTQEEEILIPYISKEDNEAISITLNMNDYNNNTGSSKSSLFPSVPSSTSRLILESNQSQSAETEPSEDNLDDKTTNKSVRSRKFSLSPSRASARRKISQMLKLPLRRMSSSSTNITVGVADDGDVDGNNLKALSPQEQFHNMLSPVSPQRSLLTATSPSNKSPYCSEKEEDVEEDEENERRSTAKKKQSITRRFSLSPLNPRKKISQLLSVVPTPPSLHRRKSASFSNVEALQPRRSRFSSYSPPPSPASPRSVTPSSPNHGYNRNTSSSQYSRSFLSPQRSSPSSSKSPNHQYNNRKASFLSSQFSPPQTPPPPLSPNHIALPPSPSLQLVEENRDTLMMDHGDDLVELDNDSNGLNIKHEYQHERRWSNRRNMKIKKSSNSQSMAMELEEGIDAGDSIDEEVRLIFMIFHIVFHFPVPKAMRFEVVLNNEVKVVLS